MEVLHGRHNELIDPALHIWGWEIPVYLFLGGLAAGLLILPALLEARRVHGKLPPAVRLAPFAAAALLTVGMVALFLDLEFKAHVLRFYLSFEPTSPMSWGSWILVLVYPVAALLGLVLMERAEREALAERVPAAGGLLRWLETRRNGVLWAAVAGGVALGTYTGLLLGTLGARPPWSTTLLGPLFLVSGVSTAAALMALFRLPEDVHHRLSAWELGLLPTEAGLIGLVLLDLASGSRAARAAAEQFLGGDWTAPFWSLVVIAGIAVPFALKAAEAKRHLPPAWAAPVLVLIGGFSLRWILVAAGQSISFAALP